MSTTARTSAPNPKKEQQEKDRKALLQKDFVKNNLIFTNDHIIEFHEMFQLYADPRTRRVDVRDILTTAKTLGLHQRYQIVFRALEELEAGSEGEVDFETFIRTLTDKMGNPFTEDGRRGLWELIDMERKEYLTKDDMIFISNELRYNLTESDIDEVIHNVAGYEADSIPYEKFEKYLARKIHKRQLEQGLLQK